MADALGVDVGESAEELVDIELDFEVWHGGLHLIEISRGPVDSFGDVFLNQVEVDFILLQAIYQHLIYQARIGGLTRSPLE